jgi:hypothetical protein
VSWRAEKQLACGEAAGQGVGTRSHGSMLLPIRQAQRDAVAWYARYSRSGKPRQPGQPQKLSAISRARRSAFSRMASARSGTALIPST